MKNSTNTALINLLTLIQFLILIPPFLLQYLSTRKMGVMRYLIFKKDMLSKEIFTSNLICTYRYFLFSGIIFCIIYLIYSYTKKANNSLVKPISGLLLLKLTCLLCIFSYKFQILLSYHFFLISFFVIITLQYVKIIFTILSNKFYKR